jgi:phosphate transport system substrate-binding protein
MKVLTCMTVIASKEAQGRASRRAVGHSQTRQRRSGWKKWMTLALLVCFCSLFAADQKAIVIVGGGSTVPLPLYKKWKDEYNKLNRPVQMDYVPFGTAEGITQITNGKSDFGAGEVLLSAEERSKANLTEVPAAIIAIVPVYNLPGVRQELRFSGELLAEIFLGEVKTWNDARITKLNPGAQLPNTPIQVIYRPGGKGTNYVFSDFLSKTSPKFREKIGRTPSPHWPVGIAAERSSDMGEKVKKTPGSIGYVEAQYLDDYQLQAGLVLNPAGKYVKASSQTMLAACRAVEGSEWAKFDVSLTNAPGADSFPITSFTWLYVHKLNDGGRAAALADLLSWMFSSNGQRIALSEGYPQMPDALLSKIKAKITSLH